jgi:hypothetical protein
MDLNTVFTKTSKGAMEVSGKSRALSREQSRVLNLVDGKSSVGEILDKAGRMSQLKLEQVLSALASDGFVRILRGSEHTVLSEELGFSSTILVGEADTQAFFEAQAELERRARLEAERAEKHKEVDRAALLAELQSEKEAMERAKQDKSDAAAKAEAERREKQAAQAREKEQAEAARRKADADRKARLEAELKAKGEAERRAREQAERKAAAEAKARVEAEAKAREEAATKARLEGEAKAAARKAAEAKAAAEAEARERAALAARMQESEAARKKAEEERQALARQLEQARLAAELDARVKRRLEARAREEEEARHRAEREAQAKLQAEARRREEAEAKAKAEAEARQRAEEEARAQAEAERKAWEEAEKRAREEAEAKAKAEAEARRRAEEEARAKAEAERKAREEAEARAEAERRAREEAEAKAKAEAEARQRAEEEARAKAEAERKAREEAEARAEAEKRAREEAEARAEAEAKAKAEAEARQRAEEEARAKAEAERRAREEAEARAAAEKRAREEAEAKAEAERRAREEAEARRRAEEEARLKAEAERRAREEEERLWAEEEAKLQTQLREREAAEQAEAQRRAEAERQARELAEQRAQAEARALAREGERTVAKAEAERKAREEAAEARRRAEEQERQLLEEEARERAEADERAQALAQARTEEQAAVERLLGGKRSALPIDFAKWAKFGALTVLAALVLVFLLAHVISFNFYAARLEAQLARSVGEPVQIGSLRFSAFPAPHWRMEHVVVGQLHDVKLAKVEVQPAVGDWFSDVKHVTRLSLDGVSLDADVLARVAQWLGRQPQAGYKFERIDLGGVKLVLPGLELPLFEGRVDLNNGAFGKAVLNTVDRRATLEIQPMADGFQMHLLAQRWTPPVGVNLQFDKLDVQGLARGQALELGSVFGELYGGSVTGKGRVSWEQGWKASFDGDIKRVDLAQAMPVFTPDVRTEGSLDAKVQIALASEQPGRLFAAPDVRATFVATEGSLGNVDLVRAINAPARSVVSGGQTKFNVLSGYLQLAKGRYQYRQLRLTLGMLSATGTVDIEPNKEISGTAVSELRSKAATIRVPLSVSGMLATPALRGSAPPAPVKAKPAEAEDKTEGES